MGRLGELASGITRAIGAVKAPGVGRPLAWDLETLDLDLIRSLPEGQMGRIPIRRVKDLPKAWRQGPDQHEAASARARELAAAEQHKLTELEQEVS